MAGTDSTVLIALVGLAGTVAGALGSWLATQRKIDASLTMDERRAIRADLEMLIDGLQDELARMTVDRDGYRQLFQRSLDAADRAITLAEQDESS